MISKRIRMKLFVALAALAAAACSVNESGKIKCVDDSSCPNDYPLCNAGVCVEGASTTRNSVAVLGVPGKQPTDPVRATVSVQVTARAVSGIRSVSLKSGSQSFTPAGAPAGSVYTVPVDTTKLAEGAVQLTATLVAGDGTTVDSAAVTITVDNVAPTLTAPPVPDAAPGSVVTLDVTASESGVRVSGTVSAGSTVIGPMVELSVTGNVHRLAFAITTGVDPGAYTANIIGVDAAGNATAAPLLKTFNVPAVPIASVTADKTTVSVGDQVVLTVNLSNGTGVLTATPGPNPPGAVTNGATFNVTPNVNTTYRLTVTNSAGAQALSSVSVSVGAVPTATLTGAATINPGQSASLTATASNATSARIQPGGISVAPDGAPHVVSVTPSVTTSFTLVAVNASGSVTTAGPVAVTVNRPVVSSFTGPAFYTDGKPGGFSLVGAFGGGTGASASVSGSDGSTCTTGTPATSPATFVCPSPGTHADVTYTLTVTLGTGANSSATGTLTVKVAPDPATSTLAVTGANAINPGSATILGGTICTGCTATMNPPVSGTLSGPYTVNTGALQTTTVFTLSVTNQTGDTAPPKSAIVNVNRPVITSFTGPSSYTAGKSNLPLRAVFGGGTGASASVVATAGTTGSTCTPASSTTSPQDFSCSAIGQDTTYTLTMTLGTGSNSTVTSTVLVKVAPVDAATTGTMAARFGATVTLLPNGRVLIAGGSTSSSGSAAVTTALIFNPTTGNFVNAGQGAGCLVPAMASARYQHTATLLGSGLVLLAGGTPDGTSPSALDTADLYDPAADCFAATGSLKAKRFGHTATRLVSGKVLVASGTGTVAAALQSAELFDGATFTTITGGTQPTLTAARSQATATLLNSGKVLVAAGSGASNADLYDPTTNVGNGSFSSVSLQAIRSQHTATLLGNGTVLLAGGAGPLPSAEIYDPASNTSTSTGSLQTGRALHTATLLPAGTVLIAGGTAASGATSSTEVFDPAGAFSTAAPLSTPRTQHGATFLFSGAALVVGGVSTIAAGDLLTP